MRRLLVAAAMFGMAQGAEAADLPDFPALRGGLTEGLSYTRGNWQGYYVGAQAGYGSSDESFTGSNSAMTASMLANTLIESEMSVSQWSLPFKKQTGHATRYGAFAGYNSQWDDVVVGVEVSYLHGKFGGTASATNTLYNLLSDGDYHSVTSSATSSIAIKDIATFRARAGYAFGSFLPYMFGGLALGNADLVRTAFVQDTVSLGPASTTTAPFLGPRSPHTLVDAQYNHLLHGYTAGLGTDVNLIGGLFVRAEWEYLRFTSSVDTTINTVRAGLGYKF
jgi:opacity protein-like surface antigen